MKWVPAVLTDLLVVAGTAGDPYEHLLTSRESAIELVVVGGVPRYGRVHLMDELGAGAGAEALAVGHAHRNLLLADPTADPMVADLTFGQAKEELADALQRLPELAREQESAPAPAMVMGAAAGEPRWCLQLDHDEAPGFALRPHLPGPAGRLRGRLGWSGPPPQPGGHPRLLGTAPSSGDEIATTEEAITAPRGSPRASDGGPSGRG